MSINFHKKKISKITISLFQLIEIIRVLQNNPLITPQAMSSPQKRYNKVDFDRILLIFIALLSNAHSHRLFAVITNSIDCQKNAHRTDKPNVHMLFSQIYLQICELTYIFKFISNQISIFYIYSVAVNKAQLVEKKCLEYTPCHTRKFRLDLWIE